MALRRSAAKAVHAVTTTGIAHAAAGTASGLHRNRAGDALLPVARGNGQRFRSSPHGAGGVRSSGAPATRARAASCSGSQSSPLGGSIGVRGSSACCVSAAARSLHASSNRTPSIASGVSNAVVGLGPSGCRVSSTVHGMAAGCRRGRRLSSAAAGEAGTADQGMAEEGNEMADGELIAVAEDHNVPGFHESGRDVAGLQEDARAAMGKRVSKKGKGVDEHEAAVLASLVDWEATTAAPDVLNVSAVQGFVEPQRGEFEQQEGVCLRTSERESGVSTHEAAVLASLEEWELAPATPALLDGDDLQGFGKSQQGEVGLQGGVRQGNSEHGRGLSEHDAAVIAALEVWEVAPVTPAVTRASQEDAVVTAQSFHDAASGAGRTAALRTSAVSRATLLQPLRNHSQASGVDGVTRNGTVPGRRLSTSVPALPAPHTMVVDAPASRVSSSGMASSAREAEEHRAAVEDSLTGFDDTELETAGHVMAVQEVAGQETAGHEAAGQGPARQGAARQGAAEETMAARKAAGYTTVGYNAAGERVADEHETAGMASLNDYAGEGMQRAAVTTAGDMAVEQVQASVEAWRGSRTMEQQHEAAVLAALSDYAGDVALPESPAAGAGLRNEAPHGRCAPQESQVVTSGSPAADTGAGNASEEGVASLVDFPAERHEAAVRAALFSHPEDAVTSSYPIGMAMRREDAGSSGIEAHDAAVMDAMAGYSGSAVTASAKADSTRLEREDGSEKIVSSGSGSGSGSSGRVWDNKGSSARSNDSSRWWTNDSRAFSRLYSGEGDKGGAVTAGGVTSWAEAERETTRHWQREREGTTEAARGTRNDTYSASSRSRISSDSYIDSSEGISSGSSSRSILSSGSNKISSDSNSSTNSLELLHSLAQQFPAITIEARPYTELPRAAVNFAALAATAGKKKPSTKKEKAKGGNLPKESAVEVGTSDDLKSSRGGKRGTGNGGARGKTGLKGSEAGTMIDQLLEQAKHEDGHEDGEDDYGVIMVGEEEELNEVEEGESVESADVSSTAGYGKVSRDRQRVAETHRQATRGLAPSTSRVLPVRAAQNVSQTYAAMNEEQEEEEEEEEEEGDEGDAKGEGREDGEWSEDGWEHLFSADEADATSDHTETFTIESGNRASSLQGGLGVQVSGREAGTEATVSRVSGSAEMGGDVMVAAVDPEEGDFYDEEEARSTWARTAREASQMDDLLERHRRAVGGKRVVDKLAEVKKVTVRHLLWHYPKTYLAYTRSPADVDREGRVAASGTIIVSK